MLLRHPNFRNFVKSTWTCTNTSRPQENFVVCAGIFKYLVRKWNKVTFGNVKDGKYKLLTSLYDIQNKIMRDQDNSISMDEEVKIRSELNRVLQ